MPENASKTFDDYSREVAASFLQTVVVFDDEAYIQHSTQTSVPAESEEAITKLVEPDPRAPTDVSDGNAPDPVRPPSIGHQLDAKLLIDSFASKGLICAVLVPGVAEDLSSQTIQTARAADIVVLDWQIGSDDGVAATSILQRVLEDDKRHGGRLRLLVIYTGENDLNTKCFLPLQAKVVDLTPVAGHSMALQLGDARVIFLKKAGGGAVGTPGEVGEKELPDKLIAEFATMTQGVLANAAMASITAMRNGTHRVLARFHPRLDGPYLAHRILSKNPEDAEQFAIDLISDEIRQVLESDDVGKSVANMDVLKSYVLRPEQDQTAFRIKKSKKPDNQEMQSVTAVDLLECLEKGLDGLPTAWSSKASLHKRIHPLFHGDSAECLKRHYEFVRVASFRREAFGSQSAPEGWSPRLGLGSVVMTPEGNYLVCLQPLCSCIRLKCNVENAFFFSPLTKNTDSFDLVVRGSAGDDVCLKFKEEPFDTDVWSFNPGDAHEMKATRSGGNLVFKRVKPTESFLVWIGDLRLPFAMRFIHRISAQLSRVGLDEFEWQRRHASDEAVE